MADDDWYKPHRPPRRDSPNPVSMSGRSGRTANRSIASFGFNGESYGWECQWLHDGELAYGHLFILRELALKEAEAQRQRLMRDGWKLPSTQAPDIP